MLIDILRGIPAVVPGIIASVGISTYSISYPEEFSQLGISADPIRLVLALIIPAIASARLGMHRRMGVVTYAIILTLAIFVNVSLFVLRLPDRIVAFANNPELASHLVDLYSISVAFILAWSIVAALKFANPRLPR